jgi:soluble lytic murein transglycosylase
MSHRLLTSLRALCLVAAVSLSGAAMLAHAQNAPDDAAANASGTASNPDAAVLDARDALRRRDRARLAADRAIVMAAQHPLAPWVDYWELGNRLSEASVAEVEAFYARWPGSYVEDRLRNDWLLELGHRRDWANFARDYPRFQMNDDREVSCYWLLTRYLQGEDVTRAAWSAWTAQRDVDEGCALLATTLVQAQRFTSDDVWRAARRAVEFNRLRFARYALGLLDSDKVAALVNDVIDQPARYLTRRASVRTREQSELTTLALMRMAWNDPEGAAGELEQRWQHALPADLRAAAWAMVAKQSALKLLPEAVPYFENAWKAGRAHGTNAPAWTDDLLGWDARASLRAGRGRDRWRTVLQAIDAMSIAEQRDPAWVYWKAKALDALARGGTEAEAARAESRQLLQSIAGQLHFYGLLAAEDLGQTVTLPPAPAPLTPAEREAAQNNAGLTRALLLIDLGLRSEGVREWNFTLRGLGDRQLLAAAQRACEREVWDRCINTSDRTAGEIDIAQRYPMPFRAQLVPKAEQAGVDPAYVYGLIRQESRFVTDARSAVGAGGLMQVMPGTAKWTAKKLGLKFTPDMLTDREMNLKLGTGYLGLVLQDFGGSQALAAAAYNAGPARSRRWRDAPPVDPVVWTENVPFNETRDYVKKVLTNAAVYQAVLAGQPVVLRPRLGKAIGAGDGTVTDDDLP